MAEASFTFDEKKFKDHLQTIKAQMEKDYAGKANHNPYLWITKNVVPLEKQFADGNRSKELFDKAMALSPVVPVINPDAGDASNKPSSSEPKNPVQLPTGLKLPAAK